MQLSSIRKNIESFGVGAYSLYLLARFMNKFSYFKVLVGMYITDATLSESFRCIDCAYDCRFLSNEEVLKFVQDETNDLPMEFVQGALERGDRCMGVLDGDRLASYGWYTPKPAQFSDELQLQFDERYIYMYRGFTRNDYRGKRLHAVGMACALKHYSAQGYFGLISYVEASNFSSLKSVYRMGYVPVGKIFCIRLLGRYLMVKSGACNEYGLGLKHTPRYNTDKKLETAFVTS